MDSQDGRDRPRSNREGRVRWRGGDLAGALVRRSLVSCQINSFGGGTCDGGLAQVSIGYNGMPAQALSAGLASQGRERKRQK